MKILITLAIFFGASFTSAVPVSSHVSGGQEHIVIIDKRHPTPPGVAEVLKRLELNEQHSDVRHIFNNSAFQGFSASMKSHCLDLLANMTDVSMVEQAVSVSRGAVPYDTRPDAPWGLQGISTSSSLGGSPSKLDHTYSYTDSSLGAGADIYIVDTGVYAEHNVFGGRAKMVWSFDSDLSDKDGHGTHVAGTAAGDILGVASKARVHGVKALDADGGGWSSNVVAGIDYVINQHDARKARGDQDFAGSVISMSLASTSPVEAISQAVNAAIAGGIHVCVAAGNNNEDACNSSPASSGGRQGGAITVGAVDIKGKRAKFSNHGDCVDVYAPGVGIVSSWIGAPNMVNSLDGTSMAAPHVTGIIAYAMANRTLADNPGLMKEWIRMVALPLGGGMLLANNGVQTGPIPAKGLITREKTASGWRLSDIKVPIAGWDARAQ
jgi:cerevisin